ncbi:pld [Symbiodinium pilosum]|uniref:Pld protein n=1 Tax=Symbiodinium pilosum TaxID=2952 RepID=A0A812TAC2_SYMPI|nr:pld [Symbiodinium pilosum]
MMTHVCTFARGFGNFRAYSAAIERGDLDFWLHLGDYIYEYGEDHYPDPSETVVPGIQPSKDVVTLQEYRQRHAHYRLDPHLQKLAASAPMIAVWDDHEVANDDFKEGAENHHPQQGPFQARKVAAIRAYHEWLPTRVSLDLADPSAAPWMRWRRFDFGSLATLLMLETRLVARTTQAEMTSQTVRANITKVLNGAWALSPSAWPGGRIESKMLKIRGEVEAHRNKTEKTMLGEDQLAWISQQVPSKGRWFLLGQPQVVQELMSPNFLGAIEDTRRGGDDALAEYWAAIVHNLTKLGFLYRNFTQVAAGALPVPRELRNSFLVDLAAGRFRIQLNFDSWTGYVAERQRLAEALRPAQGAIIYGGDSHNAWAGKLRAEDGSVVAMDFDGMAVTSPGVESERPFLPPSLEATAWRSSNPDLAWADTSKRGFMMVHLDADSHHIEYLAVDVASASEGVGKDTSCLAAFDVEHGLGNSELRVSTCRPPQTRSATETVAQTDSATAATVPLVLALLTCCLGWLMGWCLGRRRLWKSEKEKGAQRYAQHVDEAEHVPPQRMGIELR